MGTRKRKGLAALLALVILATVFPTSAFSATVINQDVYQTVYIGAKMETQADAAAVASQLPSAAGFDVSLSDDKMDGRFSLRVTAGDMSPDMYAQYTLASSDLFSITDCATVELWVKPGSGADWIEFYTNSALILGSANGVGRFEVGKDLKSGAWNRVLLNLLLTNPEIIEGQGLTVRTNDNSTWLFDDVVSKSTHARDVDLSSFVNDKTQMNNGRLEYKKNAGETAFAAENTVLVSDSRVIFSKTFETKAAFSGGQLPGGVSIRDNALLFSSVTQCTGGTAISGGGSSPGGAFTSTSGRWSSSQTGASVSGNAYIGYDFGADIGISGFSIQQFNNTYYQVDSVKLQYYDSLTSAWADISTEYLPKNGDKQTIPFPSVVTASKFRILANGNLANGFYWTVNYAEFLAYNSYVSPEMNISSAEAADFGRISCSSQNGSAFNFETSLSLNGGSTWSAWQALEGDKISGIDRNTPLQNARLKFRVSPDGSNGVAAVELDSITVSLQKGRSQAPLQGKIENIAISADERNILGVAQSADDTEMYPVSPGLIALSGDGSTLYYTDRADSNNAKNNVYKLDLVNQTTTKISSVTYIDRLVTNHDGTNVLTATDAAGTEIIYGYTPSGLLESVINGADGTSLTQRVYDEYENLISAKDGVGTAVKYSYDARGRILAASVYSDDGELASQRVAEYDDMFQDDTGTYLKISVIVKGEERDLTESFYYDARGRLAKQMRGGEIAEYGYDYMDNRVSCTGFDGAEVKAEYGPLSRMLSTTDATGATIFYTYDGLGKPASFTDALGNTSYTKYDARGLLIRQETPLEGGGLALTGYSYDAAGRLVKITDPEGGVTNYSYDERGNLVRAELGANSSAPVVTEYAYDREGRITELTVGASRRSYLYDELGRLTLETDALGNSAAYTYDAAGRLETSTDRNGVKTFYAYDAVGRLISMWNSRDGKDNAVTSRYSLDGSLIETKNAVGADSYRYDEIGRMTEAAVAMGLRKVYTYDSADRVKSLTVYQGSVMVMSLAYEYDAAGRLISVAEGGVRSTYDYNAGGHLASEENGLTGVVTEYAYTPAGQLKSQISVSGGDILWEGEYRYDKRGYEIFKSEGGEETRYHYDAAGRLKTAELPDGRVLDYEFDERSNISRRVEIFGRYIDETAYTYDLNNRLIESESGRETSHYGYDAAGNLTESVRTVSGGGGAVSEIYEYAWNGFGQLARVTDPEGALYEYAYGADGLRVGKSTADTATGYLCEGGSVILELDAEGRVVAKTVRGLGLISRETETESFGYIRNGHGDVALLVNPAGEKIWDYAYDPYGEDLGGSEATPWAWRPDDAEPDNPFRYAGEYLDAETGLYYLRARYYDPAIGRFLSEDPISAGSNWYLYCGGNPVMFVDPLGLEQVVVAGGAYHFGAGAYQYEFIDTALLQISRLDGGATLLVANAGWTYDQYAAIVQAADGRGINLVWFRNIDELTNYINTGGIDGNGNRANDPITAFYVFAHGTDGGSDNYAITFGLYSSRDKQLRWYIGDISRIESSAFSSNIVSAFYACRTGNTFGTGNFAQAWADKTGGGTYAYSGVINSLGRSDYSNILGTSLQRHGIGTSVAFRAWQVARGDVAAGPGEAWALPQASYLTNMSYFSPFGATPSPEPGPPPIM